MGLLLLGLLFLIVALARAKSAEQTETSEQKEVKEPKEVVVIYYEVNHYSVHNGSLYTRKVKDEEENLGFGSRSGKRDPPDPE